MDLKQPINQSNLHRSPMFLSGVGTACSAVSLHDSGQKSLLSRWWSRQSRRTCCADCSAVSSYLATFPATLWSFSQSGSHIWRSSRWGNTLDHLFNHLHLHIISTRKQMLLRKLVGLLSFALYSCWTSTEEDPRTKYILEKNSSCSTP